MKQSKNGVVNMTAANGTSTLSASKDFPYFRQVWKNVVVALLAASFIPLIVIGGGMYYYAAGVLRQKTLDSLRMQVVGHKNTIDRFLSERTMDLKLLAENIPFDELTRPGALDAVLHSLRGSLPCFNDLGVIDSRGRHRAYVGPHELLSKNYQKTEWFQAVKSRGVYISDVFLGFRNVPHFVIAIRQPAGDDYWILRATVDTAFFNDVVSEMVRSAKGDSFLVNRQGIFQTIPRNAGKLMGASNLSDLAVHAGVREKEENGRLRVMVWLEKVPWMYVVQIERKEIFGSLYRVRNIGIFVFILGSMMIGLTVLLTTNYLIGRLEFKRRSIRELDDQLLHTSRLASIMPLSAGFFLKIKDLLANIELKSRQLEESGDRADSAAEHLKQRKDLEADVQHQAFKGRRLIDNFLNAVRPVEPMIREVNINELLDNLIELFDREFHFNRIEITRQYQHPPIHIRSDPSRLRQVFQNLIFNAMDAVHCDGEIVIQTQSDEKGMVVTVSDSGPGIPEENLEKIFSPHFTAKPEGMGLGLSICRNIIKKLGGRITARNNPVRGASFRIELPLQFQSPGKKPMM